MLLIGCGRSGKSSLIPIACAFSNTSRIFTVNCPYTTYETRGRSAEKEWWNVWQISASSQNECCCRSLEHPTSSWWRSKDQNFLLSLLFCEVIFCVVCSKRKLRNCHCGHSMSLYTIIQNSINLFFCQQTVVSVFKKVMNAGECHSTSKRGPASAIYLRMLWE